MRFQFTSLQRRLTELAKAAQVPVAERCVRDDPLRALAITCADCGPWNVVVLAEPFSASSGAEIARLLDNVEDATGLVLVGPRARRLSGPVVMMLEDIDALTGMLRAGDRLVEGAETELVLAIVSADAETAGWIELQARLLLAERTDVHLVQLPLAHAEPALAAEAIRRMRPGFVIGPFRRPGGAGGRGSGSACRRARMSAAAEPVGATTLPQAGRRSVDQGLIERAA